MSSDRTITVAGTAVRFNEPTDDPGRSVPIMFLPGCFPRDVLDDPAIELRAGHSIKIAGRDQFELWADQNGLHWYVSLAYAEGLPWFVKVDSGCYAHCSISFEGSGRERMHNGRNVFCVRRVTKILDLGPVQAAANSRCKCLAIWPSEWKTNRTEPRSQPKPKPPARSKRRVRSSALRARMRGHQAAMGKCLPMQRGTIAQSMLESGIGRGLLCSVDGKKLIDRERCRRNVAGLDRLFGTGAGQ